MNQQHEDEVAELKKQLNATEQKLRTLQIANDTFYNENVELKREVTELRQMQAQLKSQVKAEKELEDLRNNRDQAIVAHIDEKSAELKASLNNVQTLEVNYGKNIVHAIGQLRTTAIEDLGRMNNVIGQLRTTAIEDLGRMNNALNALVDSGRNQPPKDLISSIVQDFSRKLERNIFNNVFTVESLLLWNVLAEKDDSERCERFIELGGYNLLVDCFKCPNIDDFFYNITGTSLCIVQHAHLRKYFLKGEFVEKALELLKNNDLETVHNSAGILVNLLLESADAWKAMGLADKREQVKNRVTQAIQSWKYTNQYCTEYTALGVFLQFIATPNEFSEGQHWAIWTLANLTTTDPEKYCTMLHMQNEVAVCKGEEKSGIELVEEFASQAAAPKAMCDLAEKVLENDIKWKQAGRKRSRGGDGAAANSAEGGKKRKKGGGH